MAREKYNAEKEHQIIGMYPGIKGMELAAGTDENGVCVVPETPRFYRPIDTVENFKMLFRGETPYWIPNNGWIFCDVNEFRPRQHPDNIGNHQCLDGGDYVDYANGPKVRTGLFDLKLEWEPASQGATVRPGNPVLPEVFGWKEKLVLPDLDRFDWEEMKEINKEYLATDKANQLGIQFGFWERLMNLMDVDNAAFALMDEDQEEELMELLDWLADFYVEYIRRCAKIGRIDSVMLHDDWGTQNGPFFSLETARKFFVPPMKKVVDACHELDIVFEHHCCGKAEKLIPAMIECGTDYWYPQSGINDIDAMIETYKDEHITFSVNSPVLPKGSTPEQVRQIAKDFVEKYKDAGILMCQDVTLANRSKEHDPSLYPMFADAVYEFSRIAYQDVED